MGQDLFGGSSSSGGSQQTSSSGFNALPANIQNAISSLAASGTNLLNPGSTNGSAGTPAASLFTLPALSTPSASALSQIQNQNFAITPQSISTDINEQMNPYNQDVINQIEQAQNGQESQLSQYLTQEGQFGSNRGMLGASDISQQAANQIGSFLNNQYNTSLQNALTTIPQNQAQSAQGSVAAGQLQQSQALQNQEAPVSALAALASLFQSGIPATSTGQGTSSNQASSSPGIFSQLFPAGLSDARLKENITHRGTENGHMVYDFNYIFDKEKTVYRGVMAQDIINTMPEAVSIQDGFYRVDYSKLGVNFRRA